MPSCAVWQGRSILDVLAVEAALGERLAIQFAPALATDARDNVLDCTKVARLLGWTAKTPFAEGIRRTVAASVIGRSRSQASTG